MPEVNANPSPLVASLRRGSPFVVGRPLKDDEPIFGREESFRFIADALSTFSCVNIVGERRMGKTSLLKHLLGHQAKHLPPQPNQSPLILARIDLQSEVPNAERFYGVALREVLSKLHPMQNAEGRALAKLLERLRRAPEASLQEFGQILMQLQDSKSLQAQPVILIDEFERLLEEPVKQGYSYPDFFNSLRSFIGTDDSLAMIIASRRSLVEYFSDPERPDSLTSTFPTYFLPHELSLFDDAAADALLLQKSDYPLYVEDGMDAKEWAKGHPCHLQAAGHAFYEGRSQRKSLDWIHHRREQLKSQNCMVNPMTAGSRQQDSSQKTWRKPLAVSLALLLGVLVVVAATLWKLPLWVGRKIQVVGDKFDDIAAWLMGFVFLVIVVSSVLELLTTWKPLSLIWKLLKKVVELVKPN
jgi:hypothetical protein